MHKKIKIAFALAVLYAGYHTGLHAQPSPSPIEAVNFSKVQINDNFWKPRIEKIAEVTIPVCIDQTEVKTPRIRNFEKVARADGEKHEGIYYDETYAPVARLEAISLFLAFA